MEWTYILLIFGLFIFLPIIAIAKFKLWLFDIHKWIVGNWEVSRAYASCLGAIVSLSAIILIPITYYNLNKDYENYKLSLIRPKLEMDAYFDEAQDRFEIRVINNDSVLADKIRISFKRKFFNPDSTNKKYIITRPEKPHNYNLDFLFPEFGVSIGDLKAEIENGLIIMSCYNCQATYYDYYFNKNEIEKSFFAKGDKEQKTRFTLKNGESSISIKGKNKYLEQVAKEEDRIYLERRQSYN